MKNLIVITIIALLLGILNITIPVWLATLAGVDHYTVYLGGFFGKFEQLCDVVIFTLFPLLGLITLLLVIRGKFNA